MIDFIDKTAEQDGTPLNRANLMALQGYENKDIIFGNGIIEERYPNAHKRVISFGDNSIIEVFMGEKTITKTTSFNLDGSISEVIS